MPMNAATAVAAHALRALASDARLLRSHRLPPCGTKLARREGMKVSKLMTQDVITCRATDMLDLAAEQMWTYEIGSLPVVDEGGRIVGVITDRDALMAAFTHDASLRAISVGDAMSADPFTCSPDDELAAVEAEMSRRHIHRVPVVDDVGRPLGIVSMTDLARASQRHAGVSAAEVASTLSAVCGSRRIGGGP